MKKSIVAAAGLAVLAALDVDGGEAGSATVAKWSGDAVGAFTFMFDDGWPSALDVAMPELKNRGLGATFYIVPAKGEYVAREADWIRAFEENPEFVAGNHTMNHVGFTDYEGAVRQFKDCTDYLLEKMPGGSPRLISYAQPGVENWHIDGKWMSGETEKAICDSQNLVSRPTFDGHGAVYHLPDHASMLAKARLAVTNGVYEYVIFHGVQDLAAWRTWQDYWAMDQQEFLPFFDDVKAMRDRNELWVADHISVHKYETERDATSVVKVATDDGTYAYDVTCASLDPELYDYPLTLKVAMPTNWTDVTAVQGAAPTSVTVTNGFALVTVMPGGGRLTIASADGAAPSEPAPELGPEPGQEPEPEPEPVFADIIVDAGLGTVTHDGVLDVWTNMTVTVGAGTRYVVTRVTGTERLVKLGEGAIVFTGYGSDRTKGETRIEEGSVEFGVHQSYQLGDRVIVGGAGVTASLVCTYAGANSIDVFASGAPGTVIVKDKGVFDLSANKNAAQLRPFNQIRVEDGGCLLTGAWNVLAQGATATNFWIEGEIVGSAAAALQTQSGRFVVPATRRTAVVWNGRYLPQCQYDAATWSFNGGRADVEDIPDVPVDCTLLGRIDNVYAYDDGFEKNGDGVLRLCGDNSYGGSLDKFGRTRIRGGLLLADNVSGTATGRSRVEVCAGGTLGGIGSVGGYENAQDATLNVGGNTTDDAVVRPGTIDDETGAHVVGTLTAGSDVQACPTAFNAHSALVITADATGFDRLAVKGSVTIAEDTTTLAVSASGELPAGRHVILSATEGITGSFATVDVGDLELVPQFNEDRTELFVVVGGASGPEAPVIGGSDTVLPFGTSASGASVFVVSVVNARTGSWYRVLVTDDLAKPFEPSDICVQATADGVLSIEIPTQDRPALFVRISVSDEP